MTHDMQGMKTVNFEGLNDYKIVGLEQKSDANEDEIEETKEEALAGTCPWQF